MILSMLMIYLRTASEFEKVVLKKKGIHEKL